MTVLTRDALHELVWSQPISRLAAEYGISDVALAKICKKASIPTPPRGYWAKLAAGARPKRTRLPRAVPGQLETVTFTTRPKVDSATAPTAEVERPPSPPIQVPETLEHPHALIVMSAPILRRAKPLDDGRVDCSKVRCMDIRVAPATLERALILMDALTKALETRSIQVEVAAPTEVGVWKPSVIGERRTLSITTALVEGERIPFCLEELVESTDLRRIDPEWWRRPEGRYRRRPTGKLRLRLRDEIDAYRCAVGARKTWGDSATRRVELSLNAFVDGLHDAAAAAKVARVRAEQHRREQEERERRRRAEEAERRAAEERKKQIEEEVPCWRLAQDIRAFVGEARRIIHEGGCELVPGDALEKRLQAYEAHADSIDPLTPLREEVARAKAHHDANCPVCQGEQIAIPRAGAPDSQENAAD